MRKRSSIISPLLSRHALKYQTVRLNVLPTVFLAWWRDNVIIPRGVLLAGKKTTEVGGGRWEKEMRRRGQVHLFQCVMAQFIKLKHNLPSLITVTVYVELHDSIRISGG